MTTNPQRPEVDDPRVLALAKARQQRAHSNPFNFVCPPWDGLTEQEQHLSLLDARNYLHAALDAGLVPAAVSPPPATRADEQATLRGRIAEVIREFPFHNFGLDDVSYLLESEPDTQEWVPRLADAVLAVLPPPADRAAVLREAAQRLYTALFPAVYDDMGQKAAEGVNRAVSELRRMAGEEQPGTEARDGARAVCVCGHTRAEHLRVSGRLLCDACDPDSTDNLVCKEFEAL